MSIKNLTRHCPIKDCKREMKYKYEEGYRLAKKKGSICKSCAVKLSPLTKLRKATPVYPGKIKRAFPKSAGLKYSFKYDGLIRIRLTNQTFRLGTI